MNIEELDIPNIKDLLSEQENKARSLLLNKLITNGCPIKAYDFIDPKLIQNLVAKHVIVMSEDGIVTVAYPVSALPTPHKVKLKDGRSFFAICAVDSLGSAFVFQQDIVINSSCSHCQKSVSVAIENGAIISTEPDDICVTHTDLAGEVNWAGTCWGLMNFFCTKEHLIAWENRVVDSSENIYRLNLVEALAVAKRIFG